MEENNNETFEAIDEQDILEYLYFKGLSSIAFADYYEREFERVTALIALDCFPAMQVLEEVASTYKDMMDDKMKKNILFLVSYYRFDYCKDHPEEKGEVFDLANDIISIVNTSTMNKAWAFTYNEMNIRRAKGPGFVNSVRYFNDYWDIVKHEASDDFYILYAHTRYFNDISFIGMLEEYAKENSGYASKINAILSEYPVLSA